MRVIRFTSLGKEPRLGLVQDDWIIDLTEADPSVFSSWMRALQKADEQQVSISELITKCLKKSRRRYRYSKLLNATSEDQPHLVIPLDPPEVWACGVTYLRSRVAREEETKSKGIYDEVYDASRPEIFFKGTHRSCVGPNQNVGIRFDSNWNAPEPELAFILGLRHEIIGFTVGNDMSSVDLEAENPLYLTQAKVYNNSCALGPCVLLTENSGNPDFRIRLRILREMQVAYEGESRTSRMKRNLQELREYLTRCNDVPPLTVCLTGTGIVPPEDFTLKEGDIVEIGIDEIGLLRNPVVCVGT